MNEGGTKNEACYAPGSGFVDWRKNEVVYDAVCGVNYLKILKHL